MAIEDTYSETMDAGRDGAIGDTGHKVLISRTVEGAAVGFGKPVVQGTADYGCRAPTTGDTAILGVTIRDRSADGGPVTADQFPVGHEARVMTAGVTFLTVAAAVEAGDPIHVVVADGTFVKSGGVAIPNARYETSGASGARVKARIG